MGNKTTEIRAKYEHILSHDVNELAEEESKGILLSWVQLSMTSVKVEEPPPTLIKAYDHAKRVNMSAEYRDRCCKNKKHENSKVFFCNDTQEIESLQSMACNMLRFFHKQKISKDFRWKAALVSCGTLQVLQCKCERHKKEKVCIQINTHTKEDTESSEQFKKKCNQEFCELKENISSLRSCWNKFEKMISR